MNSGNLSLAQAYHRHLPLELEPLGYTSCFDMAGIETFDMEEAWIMRHNCH